MKTEKKVLLPQTKVLSKKPGYVPCKIRKRFSTLCFREIVSSILNEVEDTISAEMTAYIIIRFLCYCTNIYKEFIFAINYKL